MRSVRHGTAAVVLAVVAAACGAAAPRAVGERAASPGPTAAVPSPVDPGTVVPSPAAPAPATPPPSPDPRLAQVGPADQAVLVSAAAYGDTTATLTGYERSGGRWRAVLGPWAARVGRGGLAPVGAKREGDGRTPSGVYGFDFFFGVAPDPGVRFPFRPVSGPSVVWDDDPASPLYNEWVDTAAQPSGAHPEPMYTRPAYDYGAVIAYNTDRTPGLGSAIFLHVSTGGPTAGCVSLPADQLVQVLRWLDPQRRPRIVLGTAA